MPNFSPSDTKQGYLPPWQLAKAAAYQEVIKDVEEQVGMKPAEFLGMRVDAYIASKVILQGGGHPSERAVREALRRCQDPTWFPGEAAPTSGGRPPIYTEHQKNDVARVAMDLKRKKVTPTPRRVRARLPQVAKNPETGKLMDKKTIRRVFQTRCYDDTEDDPWQFLDCPSQDAKY